MQKQTNQTQWGASALLVVRGASIVGIVMLCLTVLFLTAFRSHVFAVSNSGTGSATSGPTSGPVGTTITVNGTGWSEADGKQASFGYMSNSNCSTVADSQTGTLQGGKFNGWFRWPQGTPLGTYTVCVTVAGTIAIAGSFNELSTSPPQVSVSPGTLVERQQATITASNYYPQGTAVNFNWVSLSNQVEFGINGTTSDSNGMAKVNFIVPVTSMGSGPYMIEAIVGSGQPPTLSSSVNFIYNAPAVRPSPTPGRTPSPTPSPTATPTADPTPANTPTVQASTTAATGATPTPVITQTTGGNSTPTTNATSGSKGSTTNPPNMLLLVGGVAGTLFLLITILIIVLFVRRRRSTPAAAPPELQVRLPFPPAGAAPSPWTRQPGTFMNNGGLPPNGFNANPGGNGSYPPNWPTSIFTPPPDSVPIQTNLSAQLASPANGFQPGGPPSFIPPQKSPVPSYAGVAPGAGGNGVAPVPLDPTLEALRRQAQTGLFAPPRPRLDEVSTK